MKSMLLVSSNWKEKATFKLIPADINCPFNEIIFDPEVNVLAIVSKEKKQSFHMLPRLTESGDVMKANSAKRDYGKSYAEQRVALDTYYEYFINDEKEMLDLINAFAINGNSFDYVSIVQNAFNKTNTADAVTA